MSQKKKLYLEVIRILAVLLVIFNHTDGFIYYTMPGSVITHLYSLILAVLCRMAVPLFFMVSGALLLEKEESLSELFQKRIARMLIVLVIASLFYYLTDAARGRIASPGAGDFLSRLLTNGIRDSFWFLYAYISVLLLLPFFRKVAPFFNKNMALYLIGLRVLTDLLIPFANLGMGTALSFDLGFVGDDYYYMLLGNYLDREKQSDASIRKLPFVFLALTALGGILAYYMRGDSTARAAAQDAFVFLMAPAAFALLKKWIGQSAKKEQAGRQIIALGNCVFGIYLFDNFLRWQLLPLYLFLCEKTVGIFANSVYVLLTFTGGFVYTWLLKKIPVVGRYL